MTYESQKWFWHYIFQVPGLSVHAFSLSLGGAATRATGRARCAWPTKWLRKILNR